MESGLWVCSLDMVALTVELARVTEFVPSLFFDFVGRNRLPVGGGRPVRGGRAGAEPGAVRAAHHRPAPAHRGRRVRGRADVADAGAGTRAGTRVLQRRRLHVVLVGLDHLLGVVLRRRHHR